MKNLLTLVLIVCGLIVVLIIAGCVNEEEIGGDKVIILCPKPEREISVIDLLKKVVP